eukprot:COSAG01_NODE_23983_length_794_cov_79.200000_2_plen_220_part_01
MINLKKVSSHPPTQPAATGGHRHRDNPRPRFYATPFSPASPYPQAPAAAQTASGTDILRCAPWFCMSCLPSLPSPAYVLGRPQMTGDDDPTMESWPNEQLDYDPEDDTKAAQRLHDHRAAMKQDAHQHRDQEVWKTLLAASTIEIDPAQLAGDLRAYLKQTRVSHQKLADQLGLSATDISTAKKSTGMSTPHQRFALIRLREFLLGVQDRQLVQLHSQMQ